MASDLVSDRPRRLVLCLDGTWNNPYKESDRQDDPGDESDESRRKGPLLKPSNVLKLSRAVLPRAPDGRDQVTYYHIGVGALGDYPGVRNRVLGAVDRYVGGVWGAGFESNVEAAARFLAHNYRPGDDVFVFGFSRGAAQARALTRFLAWLPGLPTKRDVYWLARYYRDYLASQGRADPADTRVSLDDELMPICVQLLGVWDTVMSLGSRLRAQERTSTSKYGFHTGDRPAGCVKHVRQALALDEERFDFRPEIWRGHGDGQTLEQRWFAGVHSNIGGGYRRDGLANVALQWMVGEASALGLAADEHFSKAYKPYPEDRLYQSQTFLFSALDTVLLRRGRGVRHLDGFPPEAGFTLDPAVLRRMRSTPEQGHERLVTYRPGNLIAYLASLPDFNAGLAALGLAPDEQELPLAVLSTIGSLRAR